MKKIQEIPIRIEIINGNPRFTHHSLEILESFGIAARGSGIYIAKSGYIDRGIVVRQPENGNINDKGDL
ncbi:MAG: hypothetical protein JJE30_06035 [Desulfuromonadales bacterium]|nr:hypothetical protein [Desulfuromonadales bacterium]